MSEESGWSRRGILSPRGLGAAAGGFFGAVIPEPALPVDRSFGRWCIARRAMACEFSVFLPDQMPNPALPGEAALDVIDETEELLTVFSASSAVSYVNQHAADGPVRIDTRLYDLLERSAALSQQTHGAFDVAGGIKRDITGMPLT
ncbi:MAG: FAD:protein FMN transferase [Phycisphaerae bacterium]|nr:FAD:protein FMN transferase [Phycisphaerae bacterium]